MRHFRFVSNQGARNFLRRLRHANDVRAAFGRLHIHLQFNSLRDQSQEQRR